MDNFREWLSDNLRYIMLGGAVLLIVLVLFFGVRACVGKKDKPGDDQQVITDQQNEDSDSQSDDGTAQTAKEDDNPLVKDNGEIKELMKQYYTALGSKDVAALKTITEGLTPTEEARITNAQYIEGYELSEVYTKKGPKADTYIVYACYNYLCTGIETPVPAMSWFYVYKDAQGSLKIDGSDLSNTEIAAYGEERLKDADVAELTATVNAAYEKAKTDDPALAEFLSGLGEESDSSEAAAEGTILTANDNSNVRAGASEDAEIIGGLAPGDEVEKKGEEGEWVQIEYEGQTGYVHSSLLD